MEDQPKTNTSSTPPSRSTIFNGGVTIVHGNVGPFGVVGNNSSIQADYIAGGDMVIHQPRAEEQTRFADLLSDLKEIINKAKSAGELDGQLAQQAIDSLSEAAELAQDKQPADPPKKKNAILQKLSFVTDMIDTAVDTFNGAGSGPAKVLLHALPILGLLLKIAARIF